MRESIENEISDSVECCVRMDRDWCQGGCSAERIYLRNEGIYRETPEVTRAKGRKPPLFLRHCVKSPLCYVGFVSITEEATQ